MLTPEKMIEAGLAVDRHLSNLQIVAPLLQKINDETLSPMLRYQESSLWNEIQKLKDEIQKIKEHLIHHQVFSDDYNEQFQKFKDVLESDEWPTAVDPAYLCDNEQKTTSRAIGILEMFVIEPVKNKRVLDFGCGNGHVAIECLKREAKVIGYDSDLSKCQFQNDIFTDDFNSVIKNGPYDIVILYDVLDHSTSMSPRELLLNISKVLSLNGKVYVRNHPWCSRHGSHFYLQKNKAFLHLALDEIELARIGIVQEPVLRVYKPEEEYQKWIQGSGLKVVAESKVLCDIEPLFLTPSPLHHRIISHWNDFNEMNINMSIEFMDYVLELDSTSKISRQTLI
jgi:2-polyprenyl-3-methyl-5-hydroxy-6-metoxy-1,4-benzoquinol methylase